MTATASKNEERKICELCDMRDPVILRSNPVTENHLYFKIRRPPSCYGFRANIDGKPSTLGLLKILILDKFIECIQSGEEPKTTIIFVQSFQELENINNYLLVQLRNILRGKNKPWLVNHSAVGKLTKIDNQKRVENGQIKLFITTSVMLCGIDLPNVDMVVVTRPFSHLSSVIQAGGRGGR